MSILALIVYRLIVIVLSISAINGFGINIIKVPEKDKVQVLCTMALLKKYFHSGESLSGSVLSMSVSSAPLFIQRDLLEAINEDGQHIWSVLVKDARHKQTGVFSNAEIHEKPQGYFVIVDNLEADDLDDIFEDWKTTVNWNPLAQFVVYFSSVEETNDEMTELMIEILLSFMNKKIYNVNVIGQNEETGFYSGKTVFPYHPDNNCGNRVIAIETLDICDLQDHEGDESNQNVDDSDEENKDDNYNANNQDINQTANTHHIHHSLPEYISNNSEVYLKQIYPALFLDKFPKDLSGCPIVAAFRPWEPYIFNRANEEEDNSEQPQIIDGRADDFNDSETPIRLSGIEYKLIQTIAEHLHISIDFHIETNNLYQLFQQLIDGDIEMLVGGLDEDPSISQFVSSTIPYHQDDLTWCVAKAKRKHSLFNFLENFTSGTWTLTLIFVLIVSVNIVFIQRLSRVRLTNLHGYFSTLIRVLGIMFTQSIRIVQIPASLKISLGTTFFMSFIISNVYQSFLFSTLTNPKNTYQISHVEEIYRHRMTIMGSVENVRHLNKDGEIFKYIRESFQMCYNIEKCLALAAADEKLAVAVSRQHSFYNHRIPRESLYCFGRDENLYVYLVTMLMPKKYHLLHKINPIIQHVIESGHMQKWARDLDVGRPTADIYDNPFKSLTFNQVEGCFAISITMLLCSMCVFLLELWTDWTVNVRKTSSTIVKNIHKMIKQP